ncbi:hypothetical protein EFA46_009845 [Halarchaeum sp. CBA1220]|uniref:DUF7576 family protein n=1 Tax=Halarchaeum sp. CBA1220 TaxID=1853682 RepID=UPI000F3A7FC1|nr:hypothetical protein [Halarchaeum sp. CBA1220]QLC34494.1 hypothetical protein EFA46_009845 [Halarchaeum sp. CBA1220]
MNEGEDTADGTEFDYCANCGAELGTDEWQPISTRESESGALSFDAFCDESCRDSYTRALDAEE